MPAFTIAETSVMWLPGDYTPELGRFSPLFLKKEAPAEAGLAFRGRVLDFDGFSPQILSQSHPAYQICSYQGERFYLYHPNFSKIRFAVPYDRLDEGNVNEIFFCKDYLADSRVSFDWILGVCGLHKLLLRRGIAVLHASYVDVGGQALLFAAPSGTGKSTQADLWAKYAGAEVINGDRVALSVQKGRLYAHGYPACGSSGICVNRSLPVRAIVVLAQGADNRVTEMGTGEKFRALLCGMTVNAWEREETGLAMELAQRWSMEVPICRLVCRPDEDAVFALKAFLKL